MWVINAVLNQVVDTVTLDGATTIETNSLAVDPSGAYLYATQGYSGSSGWSTR